MTVTIEGSALNDPSRLRIRADGWIDYRLYDQAGEFVAMEIRDTPHNRRFVAWVQIHDRYVVHGDGQ